MSVAAVVVIIGALIVVKLAQGGTAAGAPRQPAPAAVVAKLTSIPLSTLTAGATTVTDLQPAQPINDPPLTSAGKPQLLYIGAEFCPICAMERWPMTIALSHFGTFANLSQTHSAVQDGNIPTLSFYGATFTSPYLTFTPVETTTNQPSASYYKPLETPTDAEMAIWQSKEGQKLGFPFIDIGGKWLLTSAQYQAAALQGATFTAVAVSIGSNDNSVGAHIDASAATLIKYLCTVTGQQPATTCQAVANVSVPGTSNPGASTPAK